MTHGAEKAAQQAAQEFIDTCKSMDANTTISTPLNSVTIEGRKDVLMNEKKRIVEPGENILELREQLEHNRREYHRVENLKAAAVSQFNDQLKEIREAEQEILHEIDDNEKGLPLFDNICPHCEFKLTDKNIPECPKCNKEIP